MFTLPISLLFIITIVTVYFKVTLGGVFSKEISKDSSYYAWFYTAMQNLFCLIGIILIFLVSGGFETFSYYTLFLGIILGFAHVGCIVFVMKAYSVGPFSYTTIITSLSCVIPALSGLVFGETVALVQYIGILFMIVCLVLSTEKTEDDNKKKKSAKWFMFTIISTLSSGVVGIVQKTHQSIPLCKNEMPLLLISSFFVATVISFIELKCKKKDMVIPKESKNKLWILPIITGLFFAFPHTINLFLVGKVPSVIVFPLVNLCPLIVIMLTGIVVFKEKLTKRQWIGVVFGILSTIFVSGLF